MRRTGIAVALTVASLLLVVRELVTYAVAGFPYLGGDLWLYLGAAQRWLDGDGWYLPAQLAGPYTVAPPVVLYPPHLLLLLLPFVAGLPVLIWWAIPAGVGGYAFARLRPSPWSWPLIVLCLAWPRSFAQMAYGNPAIWVAAALWAGGVMGWPAVLAVLKPTAAPFALLGIRRRSWWLAAVVILVVSLPTLTAYGTVLANALPSGGFFYSVEEWPLFAAPVIAWASRSRVRGRAAYVR